MASSRRARSVAIRLAGGCVLIATITALIVVLGRSSKDAEITAGSSIRNVHSDVNYVGDAKCARCHPEIAKTYREHPMGRSLADTMHAPALFGDSGPKPSFNAKGLEYQIELRGDKQIHKERKRNAEGRIIAENTAEARFVIGSGSQALAFVLDRAGYLFQSPITYYSKKKTWDLSPGYEIENVHFDRLVKTPCLFCHANRFDRVPGTENRYREPIFQGHAIGCERCHGPGELHLKNPKINDPAAPNIVNPAKLSADLRESVCQQCHLQGDIRIVRAGRELEEYRPGLPLHRFESIFVKASGQGKTRFFGQVEQMYESRCFKASSGKMGCISCHDPHELPSESEKVDYYRGRCLDCHADRGCKLPREQRLTQSRDDNCIECHMPRSPNQQVPHTATTLHLISRFISDEGPPISSTPTTREEFPLVNFHRDLLDLKEQKETRRDIGIALTERSRGLPGLSPQTAYRLAIPLLEESLKSRPDDPPALLAKGNAQWELGRREASLTTLREAVNLAPGREEILVAAGTKAAQLGKTDEALLTMKQAVAINPWRGDYHQVLALVYTRRSDWPNAVKSAREAVRLGPFEIGARMVLIQALLGNHETAEAKSEFQTLLDLEPPNRSALEEWFRKNSSR